MCNQTVAFYAGLSLSDGAVCFPIPAFPAIEKPLWIRPEDAGTSTCTCILQET